MMHEINIRNHPMSFEENDRVLKKKKHLDKDLHF